MKRIAYLLLALLLVVACLTACDQPANTSGADVNNGNAVAQQGGTQPSEEPETVVVENSANGQYPPLTDDLVTMYQGAELAYSRVADCGNIQYDASTTYEVDGKPYYYAITDENLDTYDEFLVYLEEYFTEDYAFALLDRSDRIKKGPNGEALVVDAGRGSDISYAGHVFTAQQEGDTVNITATVYNLKNYEVNEAAPFYTTPSNPDDYEVTNHSFVLKKTDVGWRYSQFVLFV